MSKKSFHSLYFSVIFNLEDFLMQKREEKRRENEKQNLFQMMMTFLN